MPSEYPPTRFLPCSVRVCFCFILSLSKYLCKIFFMDWSSFCSDHCVALITACVTVLRSLQGCGIDRAKSGRRRPVGCSRCRDSLAGKGAPIQLWPPMLGAARDHHALGGRRPAGSDYMDIRDGCNTRKEQREESAMICIGSYMIYLFCLLNILHV